MDDIARMANVAKSTVSRALQGDLRVKPATREFIVSLARKEGYAVNSNARKLRQNRSNTIAVVMHLPPGINPGESTPFMFQLLAEVATGLWLRRQDLLLCAPGSDDTHVYRDMLASKGADGLIFLGQGPGDDWLSALARTRAPFVVWGAVDEEQRYATVGSDNIKGGELVGARFVQLARKHVVFIGNRSHPEMAHRWTGLQRGLAASPTRIEVEAIDVPDFSYETAHEHALSRLSNKRLRRPDAFFAASDTMAIAVVSTIQQLGFKVPDDISVIGYNDDAAAKRYRPALTTVRQDTRQAGSLLVEKLFQVLDGARPSSTTLPTDLVVRET